MKPWVCERGDGPHDIHVAGINKPGIYAAWKGDVPLYQRPDYKRCPTCHGAGRVDDTKTTINNLHLLD